MSSVSIIIPNLNDNEYLEQLVCQLEKFRPSAGWEIVVVDGGSTVYPGTIATKVDQLIVSKAGRATQLNAGIASSKGHLLWMLHADSSINAEVCRAIETLSERGLAEGHPDRIPLWGRFNVQFSQEGNRLSIIAFFMNHRSRITGICTGDQGIFVERSLLDRIGGVPDQKLMEDIEMSRRLKCVCNPECRKEHLHTSPRRWRHAGVVRTIIFMWAMRAAYFVGVSPDRLARVYYGSVY